MLSSIEPKNEISEFCIDARNIAPFSKVAIHTHEGQVLLRYRPTVFSGICKINLIGIGNRVLMASTKLGSIRPKTMQRRLFAVQKFMVAWGSKAGVFKRRVT